MDSKFSLSLSLLCFVARFCLSFSASEETKSFESVPDLEKSMYTHIEGFPCVRLLNLSGEIGCSNSGREKVIAPIVRYKDAKELVGSAAILVSVDEFESLLSRVSKDLGFVRKVAGILVESRTQDQNGLKGLSPDAKFPQAEFAPYQSNNFEWNPAIIAEKIQKLVKYAHKKLVSVTVSENLMGLLLSIASVSGNLFETLDGPPYPAFRGSGSMWKAYDFPVFLLSPTSTSILQEAALTNEKSKTSHIQVVAEFDLVMQTTKSGTRDSDSCLKEGFCLPLGGYSVWSALPPINISSSLKAKPIVLMMTSMDSTSFFRDKSLGAESPLSGLIALLAVVDALSRLDGLKELDKQLVFLALTGEAWGYLGSRRFFLESDQQSETVKGLDLAMIDSVMEIGSVGKSFPQGTKTFFAHTAGGANGPLNALQRAQDSLIAESIMVKTASKSNPGVPPSSLMTFLRKMPHISGLVLEDFDSAFSNEFYHSHLDDLSNVNSSSIVAAASLVARSLYILAGGKDPAAIDSIKINATLVEELLGCLLNCEPGLSCALVQHYITPSTTCPSHYVGVILGEPSFSSYPPYAGDISRFVRNFLADKTSIKSENISSSCPKDCKGVDELCIREETDGKGVCVISTTRYVPAYSTRLKYESESWTVVPQNSSDIMGASDPVWTESNWDIISVRMYAVQNTTYDNLILLLGIAVTVFAYILIEVARAVVRKALKQD